MDGWQDKMLASGQEGANAGPAAVHASAAGPASITSDAWPRCSCTNAAPACLLHCGLQDQIKESTHNAFKFGTALQKLALTYLLQYAEYARKYARKYAEYDKKYAEYDK